MAGAGGSGAAAAGAPAAAAAPTTTPTSRFFGPYDDLSQLLLPAFEERAFLAALEAAGGPRHHRLLRTPRWRELYAGFIASPHFWPWFNARRAEAARQFYELARVLRFAVPPDELLRSIPLAYRAARESAPVAAPAAAPAPAADAPAPPAPAIPQRSFTGADAARQEAATVELHHKITSAFVREAHLLRHDDALLRVMRRHLAAVEDLLPAHARARLQLQARQSAALIAGEN
jgi:hypothetical protein